MSSPEGAERQILPKSNGFAEMLKATLSDNPQNKVREFDASEVSLTVADLESSSGLVLMDKALDLDTSQTAATLGFPETTGALTLSQPEMPITTGALTLSQPEMTLTTENGGPFENEGYVQEPDLSVEAVDLDGELLLDSSLLSEAFTPVVDMATSDVALSDVSGINDQSLGQNVELDSILDEELVLGQGLITPEVLTDKGLMSSGTEKLGDRTVELRQEAKIIKLNSAGEQIVQNTASQKSFSSDEQGQQSRGQSSQQQFMAMAQSVSQNTQIVRDQQIERQFTNVLTERMASQNLGDKALEQLNSRSISTESRAQLPVGLQSIGLPVTHQKWGQALGQRVVYMANQQMQNAQITLNPEKLGPVQIRLQIDRDQKVNVVMTAQHGITRESMEAAMPRLREMLEQAGINVGSVDVNDQKQFENKEQEQSESQQASSGSDGEMNENRADGATETSTYATDNVVDYYA